MYIADLRAQGRLVPGLGRRAVEADPVDPELHGAHADILSHHGRLEEALREAALAAWLALSSIPTAWAVAFLESPMRRAPAAAAAGATQAPEV